MTWHVCLIPTNLAFASDHQARAFDSTTLVVVEDRYQSDMPPALFDWSFSPLNSLGVVTFREYVETVAPPPTVDVKVCDCDQDDGRKTVSEQGVQRVTSKSKKENCVDISSRALEANKHGYT